MAESYFSLSDADRAEVLEVGRERTGRPAHLLEKDVWVVWTLGALFGSPTTSDSHARFASSSTSAKRSRGTSMRDGATQVCPVLPIIDVTPWVTAFARSAVGRMMLADLPPSSRDTRLQDAAAALEMLAPAAFDPVSETMSTNGCEANTSPSCAPSPCTRLNTPAGTPASCRISAITAAEYGAF